MKKQLREYYGNELLAEIENLVNWKNAKAISEFQGLLIGEKQHDYINSSYDKIHSLIRKLVNNKE